MQMWSYGLFLDLNISEYGINGNKVPSFYDRLPARCLS
jgi:hypothetical protein